MAGEGKAKGKRRRKVWENGDDNPAFYFLDCFHAGMAGSKDGNKG